MDFQLQGDEFKPSVLDLAENSRSEQKHPVLKTLYQPHLDRKERLSALFGLHASMRMDLDEYFLSKTTEPIDSLRGTDGTYPLERVLGLDRQIIAKDYLTVENDSFQNFDKQFQKQICSFKM